MHEKDPRDISNEHANNIYNEIRRTCKQWDMGFPEVIFCLTQFHHCFHSYLASKGMLHEFEAFFKQDDILKSYANIAITLEVNVYNQINKDLSND